VGANLTLQASFVVELGLKSISDMISRYRVAIEPLLQYKPHLITQFCKVELDLKSISNMVSRYRFLLTMQISPYKSVL